MNGIMDYWSVINTVVIMLALGLANDKGKNQGSDVAFLLRATVGYNFFIPMLALVFVKTHSWFSADAIAAMTLCIAAAGGTSAGAFVSLVKGSASLAAKLIIALVGVSLAAIALFSKLQWIALGDLSLTSLGMYLLAITLIPLVLGYFLRRRYEDLSSIWQPRIERVGGLLVILLVLVLAMQYGRDILTGPSEPILAAFFLVVTFLVPPLFEPDLTHRRTIVLVTLIRNLTLVLSMLAVLPHASNLIPTVLAFGLFMYLMTGLLVLRWRNRVEGI